MGNLVLAGATSGSTTITPSATGTYTITLPAETGTIQTSGAGFTTNGVAYATSTSALATGSGLVFDGANLGIGVTPSSFASNFKVVEIGTVGNAFYGLNGSNSETGMLSGAYYNAGWKYSRTGVNPLKFAFNDAAFGQMEWYNAPSGTAGNAITWTQAMTLDSSGNLLVNTTSVNNAGYLSIDFNGQSKQGIVLDDTYTSTGGAYMIFRDSTGATAGYISHVTATTVAYVTTSDYRLKENVKPMTGALAKIAQLKPVTYKWKSDGLDGQGFIAHELAEVVPDCVAGEKDALYPDGSIKPQGTDTSFLVATLVSALQELSTLITAQSATITSLTERITALEGK
jgi:hypothetical protein